MRVQICELAGLTLVVIVTRRKSFLISIETREETLTLLVLSM